MSTIMMILPQPSYHVIMSEGPVTSDGDGVDLRPCQLLLSVLSGVTGNTLLS